MRDTKKFTLLEIKEHEEEKKFARTTTTIMSEEEKTTENTRGSIGEE